MKNTKIFMGLFLLFIIIIHTGCTNESKPKDIDIEKAFEEVVAETIIEAEEFMDKQAMLSKVRDSVSCSCSKSTNSCTLIWKDTNTKKIVESATLEVWSGTRSLLNKQLLFEETVVGSNGTITYTIEEETFGNKYFAECFFESNEWFDNYD